MSGIKTQVRLPSPQVLEVQKYLNKRISELDWTIEHAESLQTKHDAICSKRELTLVLMTCVNTYIIKT